MRTILIIVAVAMLGIWNDAFAQAAPKEVVVVGGQIAVNNLPESQTINGTVSVDNLPAVQEVEGSVSVNNLPSVQDVWVQGATNPIPVVNVTAPVGEQYFGTLADTASVHDSRIVFIDIPTGKQLVLKLGSLFVQGAHANVLPRCSISMSTSAGNITYLFDVTVNRFSTRDLATVFGNQQFSDLPPVDSVFFRCFITREDLSAQTRSAGMTVSWFGYLYDAPTP